MQDRYLESMDEEEFINSFLNDGTNDVIDDISSELFLDKSNEWTQTSSLLPHEEGSTVRSQATDDVSITFNLAPQPLFIPMTTAYYLYQLEQSFIPFEFANFENPIPSAPPPLHGYNDGSIKADIAKKEEVRKIVHRGSTAYRCLDKIYVGDKTITWDNFFKRNYVFKDNVELVTIEQKKQADIFENGQVFVGDREIAWYPKSSRNNTGNDGLVCVNGKMLKFESLLQRDYVFADTKQKVTRKEIKRDAVFHEDGTLSVFGREIEWVSVERNLKKRKRAKTEDFTPETVSSGSSEPICTNPINSFEESGHPSAFKRPRSENEDSNHQIAPSSPLPTNASKIFATAHKGLMMFKNKSNSSPKNLLQTEKPSLRKSPMG